MAEEIALVSMAIVTITYALLLIYVLLFCI